MPSPRLIIHQIPVCPFSQRLKILLALKGLPDAVEFHVVDVTRPRDPELLRLSRGSTALPILETDHGVLRESLVILRYLDELFSERPIAQALRRIPPGHAQSWCRESVPGRETFREPRRTTIPRSEIPAPFRATCPREVVLARAVSSLHCSLSHEPHQRCTRLRNSAVLA
jgi:glutathione S-transferase